MDQYIGDLGLKAGSRIAVTYTVGESSNRNAGRFTRWNPERQCWDVTVVPPHATLTVGVATPPDATSGPEYVDTTSQ